MENPQKRINLWWSKTPVPGNFGDILSPLLLRELGLHARRVDRGDANKFIAIGSTVRFTQKGDTVWGAGVTRLTDEVELDADFLAVRGPITGRKVSCFVYGDPGILCSRLLPLEPNPVSSVGYVPHYVDFLDADVIPKIGVLDANPLNVIEQVLRHEKIVSSSLHGIILAHSYGIPAAWWRPSNKLDTDGSKFFDYAASVGIKLEPESDPTKVTFTLPDRTTVREMQDRLILALQRWRNRS